MKIGLPLSKQCRTRYLAEVALPAIALAFGGMFAQPLWAQAGVESGGKQSFSVVPRLSVSERYTNNVDLQSSGKQAEFVTQISPGISIRSAAGRIKGSFDYSLNELVYARNSQGRQSQNSLTSSGVVEAVDNWAFIDFSGAISQQAVSAFGTQSNNTSTVNGNSSETSIYRLSPYLRGRLGGSVDYEARYSWSATRSGLATASDVKTKDASVKLNGSTRASAIGWSVEATSQDVNYSLGRVIAADRLGGTLTYLINPQLNVYLSGARESNNYTTFAKESHSSTGVGLNWSISERSKLAAKLDQRSFGKSHSVSFEHRTALTAWKFSDSRNVSTSPVQSGSTSIGALGDLLFSQFAALEPDPLKRAELVNKYLQDNGLSSDTRVISNFLASSVSLQRRQDASVALLGVRDTVSFSLTRGSNSKLDGLVTAVDDFSTSAVIHQSGASISYAHRLTSDSALNVVASRQNTSGTGGQQSTSLRSIDVRLSGKLGLQTSASIGARRVVFDSATVPYTETSVTGNLNVQF